MNGALDGALGCALDAVAHAICSASVGYDASKGSLSPQERNLQSGCTEIRNNNTEVLTRHFAEGDALAPDYGAVSSFLSQIFPLPSTTISW